MARALVRPLLTLLAAVSCACGAAGAAQPGGAAGDAGLPFTSEQRGEATYYDADGTGACSFPVSPGDLDVAALNAVEWDGSAHCGACVRVRGPKGELAVRIVDLCPECKKGDLDLSREAFAKIADPIDGRVQVTWTAEPCAVAGPIRWHVKEGSNPHWVALQVRNHRLPVARVEYRDDAGAWVALERQSYNYFAAARADGTIEVRATATSGEALVDTISAAAGRESAGGAQMR